MTDTKMLQLVIDKITAVDKKVDNLSQQMEEGFKKVNGRIDKLGNQLAYLEDDDPTNKEFRKLERRVHKLELQIQ